jgi:hypothetical protein
VLNDAGWEHLELTPPKPPEGGQIGMFNDGT